MIVLNGWLKKFIETQMSGLTGNIGQCGYPFDSLWWGTDKENGEKENSEIVKSGWWVYEQTAYWLDGFVRCAVLLGDRAALEKAKAVIYGVVNNKDSDGYLGPKFMKETNGWNRWPHVVFFRACIAYCEYTNDKTVERAMVEHYLKSPCDYAYKRDVNNVEIMLWLYGRTGNKELLNLAEKSYRDYNIGCDNDVCDKVALSDKKPYAHGVTYCEYSKLGAILYLHTKNNEYLKASKSALDKAKKLFMLPGGCLCSDEFLISDDYMESYETCVISDFTWALYYLAKATGDVKYYDDIESCIYNAGLGSTTEDFRALQYFSCANQTIADNRSNHNLFHRGSKWMSYRPTPGTECCPGNVNRFMPNFVMHLWDAQGDKIYCNLYGASEFVYNGIRITETTNYPFEEVIRFSVKTDKKFVLSLRIPEWAKAIDLKSDCVYTKKDGYIELEISKDCEFVLAFESDIERITTSNGLYFKKGVLRYSLGGKERRERDETETKGNSEEFPALNMYPEFEWRYGIEKNADIKFESGNGDYYGGKGELPKITLDAYLVPEWDYERYDKVTSCWDLYNKRYEEVTVDATFTPRIPERISATSEKHSITLYPYGSCKLRVTVFPIVE